MIYIARREGVTYRITELYEAPPDSACFPAAPKTVYFLYESNSHDYRVFLPYFGSQRPSVEWLTSFGVPHAP